MRGAGRFRPVEGARQKVWLLASLMLLLAWTAQAHVGSPDVFFTGQAGPYPVRVTIRVPPVVPGRAQIEVRPQTTQPLTVSVLPLYAKSAVRNAPPAETARPVPGEPGLFSGELWLMGVGAYSIEVRVAGAEGEGTIQIPVNSVATHQLPLPAFLGNLLLGLGGILSLGLVAIVYAAAGESVLAPEAHLEKAGRRKALVAGAIGAGILVLLLAGGWRWWSVTEQAFRRTLREGAWPDLAATVETQGAARVLHLTLGEKAFKPDYALPLLPDHGKLLHLFLIREPSRDVFAHLHPVRTGGKSFDLALPELPEGDYRILCDFTLSDSGLSSTATGLVHLPPPPAASPSETPPLRPDSDDSWFAGLPADTRTIPSQEAVFPLLGGGQARWLPPAQLRAKSDAHLEFSFQDANGHPLPLEPYMGMLSHAAVYRTDGAVFSHLHPTGNFSMAAQSYFATKIARETSPGGSSGGMEEMDHSKMHHASPDDLSAATLTLPYEFPSPGDYQIWVQIKTGGKVRTATFLAHVAP